MTTTGVARILDSDPTGLEGQPGLRYGVCGEVPIRVFSDESHDRVRLMAPPGATGASSDLVFPVCPGEEGEPPAAEPEEECPAS